MKSTGWGTRLWLGLMVGFALNVTGWLGNNLLLGSLWNTVEVAASGAGWRASMWSDVFSLLPDFVYGLAIVWLCSALRAGSDGWVEPALSAGTVVSLVGGITTYFAVANSGFIPWRLALASFLLVVATKIPLALLAGWMLDRTSEQGHGYRPPGSA